MNRQQKAKTQPLCISLPGAYFTPQALPAAMQFRVVPRPAPPAAPPLTPPLNSTADGIALAAADEMTPFSQRPHDIGALAAVRRDLASQPSNFYGAFFGGRSPTEAEKLDLIDQTVKRVSESPIYMNNLYTVQIEEFPPFLHLLIHRNDWAPCKDWRHFQQIKNELVGIENEAVELFPAESRLMDTSNTYHLWVHRDPAFRFPLGLQHRLVTSTPFGHENQRQFA